MTHDCRRASLSHYRKPRGQLIDAELDGPDLWSRAPAFDGLLAVAEADVAPVGNSAVALSGERLPPLKQRSELVHLLRCQTPLATLDADARNARTVALILEPHLPESPIRRNRGARLEPGQVDPPEELYFLERRSDCSHCGWAVGGPPLAAIDEQPANNKERGKTDGGGTAHDAIITFGSATTVVR